MNDNRVSTYRFSNPDSERIYKEGCVDDLRRYKNYTEGGQCGGCSFFAKFNADYGLCCHAKSAHFTETVFEHFTCPAYVEEGWGPHSFSEDPAFHCKCGGHPVEPPPIPSEAHEARLKEARRRRRRKRHR